jgi:hypothetical protein
MPNREKIVVKVINILQIKDINKCPAIMLAVSRKVNAKGRIKLLNTSTTTINLIKKTGVPKGIKWVVKNLK